MMIARITGLMLLCSAATALKQVPYAKTQPDGPAPVLLYTPDELPILLPGCKGLERLSSQQECGLFVDKSAPNAVSAPVGTVFTAAIHGPRVHGSDEQQSVVLTVVLKEGEIQPTLVAEAGQDAPRFFADEKQNVFTAEWAAGAYKTLRLRVSSSSSSVFSLQYSTKPHQNTQQISQNGRRAATGPASAPTVLTDGRSVTGFVNFQSYEYFSFTVNTALTSRVDVILTPLAGDPDLYITLNGQTPSTSNYQYRSVSLLSTDAVTIRSNDSAFVQFCGLTPACAIQIAVYGWRRANYSLVATTQSTAAELEPGFPFIDAVGTSEYNYYFMPVTVTAGTASVSFQLTPFSGDPDIFVGNSALNQTRPSLNDPTSFCAFSNSNTRDVIDLHPGQSCWCQPPCTYYVSVLGFGSSATYSLLGLEIDNATVTLINGVPQASYAGQGETDQYALTVIPDPTIPGRQVIEFTLTPYMGDPDLFVTLDGRVPSPTSWDYRSISANGIDSIAIRTNDPKYLNSPCGAVAGSACRIRVAVYAFTSAIYTIVGNNGRFLQLQDNRQLLDAVPSSSYVYYRFTSSQPDRRIIISVTPMSGDPDVYVGSDRNATTTGVPTRQIGTFFWRSSGFGTEVIPIEPYDQYACAPPCNYYIGVYGYRSNATFSILVRTESTVPTPLVLGQPVSGTVNLNTYTYFTVAFSQVTLDITVTPNYGDPDLFVRLDNTTVTWQNAQYSSTYMSGVERVSIQPTDATYQTYCSDATKPCIATIGIFGFTTAAFTITASTGVTSLPDGVAVFGSATNNQYVYYRYTVTSVSAVTIAVTPLSGDPDLFVSTQSTQPNVTNFQWRSNGFGSEVVYITASNPIIQACGLPCPLYISVLAWANSATYSISASSSDFNTLIPGNPVVGYAAAWTFSYFLFNNYGNPNGLEFTVTPMSGGDISVYVNNQLDRTGSVALPTFSCPPNTCPDWLVVNSMWSSVGSISRERVTVPATSPYYRPNGTYVVAVLALGQDAEFSLTGVQMGAITRLQPGVPFEDVVGQRQYNYYRLVVNTPNADVLVTVTPFFGDPDLFISLHSSNMFPNQTNADRKAQSGTGVDSLYIQWQDMPECVVVNGQVDCDVWISVYGFNNASYSITPVVVSGTNVTSMLIDGVPASGEVAARQYTYYYASVNVPPGTTFSVYLRPLTGDPDLYIRTDGQQPTNIFYQASSTAFAGDEIINISPDKPYYNSSCLLRIAVFGFQASRFQITFSTSASVVQMADGVSQFATVGGGGQVYNYFSFAVGPTATDVSFSLTALSGDPDIYVGVWTTPQFRPTSAPSQHTWAGTYFGSDSVLIPATDGNACTNCQYIAGVVCAIGVSCRYTLTATTASTSLIQLSDGQPLSNTVNTRAWKYFVYETGTDPTMLNVTFQVVSSTGNAQLYITNQYVPGTPPTGQLPSNTVGSYVWSSASGGMSSGSGIVTIPGSSPNVSPNNTIYTIGVFGVFGPASFTITATSARVPQSLVPGQPSTQHQIEADTVQYFSVALVDTTTDLLVAATLMDGDVLIAVGSDPTTPPVCATNADNQITCNVPWTTINADEPQLRISALNPCSGVYVTGACSPSDWHAGQFFIAVYATTDTATYAITAYESQAAQRLIDGQPQQASTIDSNAAIFSFQTAYDPGNPDLRITIAADSIPLVFYINSCYEAQCTADSINPSPSNFETQGYVDAQSSVDYFISLYGAAYCSDASGQTTCNYFISVYPGVNCDQPSCSASFSIVAAEQDGQLTRITYASVNNRVLLQPGNIAPGASATYEVYLDPTHPVAVNIQLDSCGPGFPNLYVCNPSAQTSRCLDPFDPSATSNTGSAATSLQGFAKLSTAAVTSSTFFISVAADNVREDAGSSRSLLESATTPEEKLALGASMPGLFTAATQQSQNWGYSLAVSAGGSQTLWPGSPNTLTVEPSGVSVKLSWAAATIGSFDTPGIAPAAGVTYMVFVAQKGFSKSQPNAGIVSTTPCGLYRWASLSQFEPIPAGTETSVVVNDLEPNTEYEFNVMALCDKNCWAVNRMLSSGDRLLEEIYEAAEKDVDTAQVHGMANTGKLYAPGYNIQRVAYSVAGANTGNAPTPPTSPSGFPPAGVAAIIVALVCCGAGGFMYMRYRRRKAYDHLDQYNSVDVFEAMDTISTPATRGGFFSSVRGMLSGNRSSTNAGVNSSYVRPGPALASSDYSTLDDKVEGYL